MSNYCNPHGGYSYRRYISKKEKIDWLTSYKEELENEVAGVTERIAELEVTGE